MITEKTLFILGAGASVPYGYPTGKELRAFICGKMNKAFPQFFGYRDMQEFKNPKSPASKDKNKFLAFCEYFKNSSRPSIDLFLATNPEHMEIGKLTIIRSLYYFEKHSKFREDMDEDKIEQDWYRYLWERMTETLIEPDSYKRFKDNRISFITFNYDRSLEYFLYSSFINAFSKKDLDILKPEEASIIKRLPFDIVHVHGELAPLHVDNSTYAYRSDRISDDDKSLANNIKIVYESNNNINLYKMIKDADRIYFLGFGYADENLKILGIPESLEHRQKIYGSAFGYTKREINAIKNKITKPPYNYPEFEIQDVNCYALLREYL